MIDDSERREVARRLREYVDLPDDWWAETYSGFYVEKCAFGNVERHRESELCARLADLIEPSEPKVRCVAEVKVDGERLEQLARDAAVELTGIYRDALLALADGLENNADNIMRAAQHAKFFKTGPTMEEAKHDAYEWRCIARRIREACGEGER